MSAHAGRESWEESVDMEEAVNDPANDDGHAAFKAIARRVAAEQQRAREQRERYDAPCTSCGRIDCEKSGYGRCDHCTRVLELAAMLSGAGVPSSDAHGVAAVLLRDSTFLTWANFDD